MISHYLINQKRKKKKKKKESMVDLSTNSLNNKHNFFQKMFLESI